jgi:hypothetical protein
MRTSTLFPAPDVKKSQHGRALQAENAPRTAPMLEFTFFCGLLRHPVKAFAPAVRLDLA